MMRWIAPILAHVGTNGVPVSSQFFAITTNHAKEFAGLSLDAVNLLVDPSAFEHRPHLADGHRHHRRTL
jgi:hypothetical protein